MTNLIVKQHLSHKVIFTNDGWINATQMAKNYDKIAYEYLCSKSTKIYMEALAECLNCDMEELFITQKSNTSEFEQEIFLHPKLVSDFARWISPQFAVWCDEQISTILNPKIVSQSLPNALRLYADQLEKNEALKNTKQI